MFTTIRGHSANNTSLDALRKEVVDTVGLEGNDGDILRNPRVVGRIFGQAVELKKPDWLFLAYKLGADTDSTYNALSSIKDGSSYMAQIINLEPNLYTSKSHTDTLMERSLADGRVGLTMDLLSRGLGDSERIIRNAVKTGDFALVFSSYSKGYCDDNTLLKSAVRSNTITAFSACADVLVPVPNEKSSIDRQIILALSRQSDQLPYIYAVRRPPPVMAIACDVMKQLNNSVGLLEAYKASLPASGVDDDTRDVLVENVRLSDVINACISAKDQDTAFDLIKFHGADPELLNTIKDISERAEAYFHDFDMSPENHKLFTELFGDLANTNAQDINNLSAPAHVTQSEQYEDRKRQIETDPSPPSLRM